MRRWIAWALAFGVLGLLAVAVVLWLVARQGPWRDAVAARIGERIGQEVSVEGRVLPLLGLEPGIAVERIRLDAPAAAARRLRLRIERAELRLDLAALLRERSVRLASTDLSGVDLTLELDPQGGQQAERIELARLLGVWGRGRFRDARVELATRRGERHRLRIETASYAGCGGPLALQGRVNETPLALKGTLQCPVGASFGLEAVEIALGASDLRGRAELELGGGVPAIRADLESAELHLDDLRRAAGAPAEAGGEPTLETPLAFDGLTALDAVLRVAAGELWIGDRRLRAVDAALDLRGGRGVLDLASADWESGQVEARLELDAAGSSPSVVLQATVDELELASLLPRRRASGPVRLLIDVRSRGARPRELLQGLSGRVDVVLGDTRTDQPLLGPLGRDLFGIVFSRVEQEQWGHLQCAVLRSEFHEGRGAALVVLDTEDATLGGGGNVDLHTLELDVLLRPQPKRASIAALKTPIRIEGALTAPEVHLDKQTLARDTGVALLYGAVNPFLLVVPLVDLGSGGENGCVQALEAATAQVEEKRGPVRRAVGAVRGAGRNLGDRWLPGRASEPEAGGGSP